MKGFSRITIIFAGVILAFIIFVPSYYFYSKYNQAQKLLKDPSYLQKQEVSNLEKMVGKLIDLPQGEDPTIATVSDKDKLSKQPFFAKAENGDKVLIYTKAKKAILYRPSSDKIIEVGPVTIGDSQSQEASPSISPSTLIETQNPTTTPTIDIKIAIYNASKTVGLAASTEARLKSQFNNITVVEKANSTGDYSSNLIIDLSGKRKDLTANIAGFLGGEVDSFPSTEVRPNAEILVIVVR